MQGEALIETFTQLQSQLGHRPVLFNTHERAVFTLSQHRNRLAAGFRFRLPRHETVVALQDKARFHELAITAGLQVPRGAVLNSHSEIGPALHALTLPLVVKPANKETVHVGTARGVWVCRKRDEAVITCARTLKNAGETLLQEWRQKR
jgi:D-aspartate ligase